MRETLEFFTEDELIDRVWDREDIQKLMAKRVYMAANEERRREINELWVSEPKNRKTASYGKNWGYYIGMDDIIKYYVVGHNEKLMASLRACAEKDASISAANENIGFGYMSVYPLSTPLIEISGDGKTAQGIWYSIGQETTRLPGGAGDAVWHSQKLGADFIKEQGLWKIWHLVEIMDVNCRAGEDYSKQPVIMTPDDPSLIGTKTEFGAPDYELLTHDSRFNWRDHYPWMPEPYFTYSDERGFGPKGHPKFKEQWEV